MSDLTRTQLESALVAAERRAEEAERERDEWRNTAREVNDRNESAKRDLTSQLAATKEENERLKDWFRDWNSCDDGDYCPDCGQGKWQHLDDCDLKAAIAAAPSPEVCGVMFYVTVPPGITRCQNAMPCADHPRTAPSSEGKVEG